MPTPPSQVDICNLALRHVAGKPITAITDTTPEAIICSAAWYPALKETLRSNNWSFAKCIEALTLLTSYTPLSWEYAYSQPVNAAAVWKIYSEGTVDKSKGDKFDKEYDKTGNQVVIVTDTEDAYCEYTFFITDTTLFTSDFVTAFSYRLAAEIAVPLNGDVNQAANMTKLYNNAISEAQRLSSNESNLPDNSPNQYVSARV